MPLIPVPTVARIGAQPFGAAASYKLAAYANGDFAGLNMVTTITPNIKINFTYVQVEEELTGTGTRTGATHRHNPASVSSAAMTSPSSSAPEITPLKGLDLKPMYSYFYASGTTNVAARQGRGGVNTTTAFTNAGWQLEGGHQREPPHGGSRRAAAPGAVLA